jgi:hypothetical protein
VAENIPKPDWILTFEASLDLRDWLSLVIVFSEVLQPPMNIMERWNRSSVDLFQFLACICSVDPLCFFRISPSRLRDFFHGSLHMSNSSLLHERDYKYEMPQLNNQQTVSPQCLTGNECQTLLLEISRRRVWHSFPVRHLDCPRAPRGLNYHMQLSHLLGNALSDWRWGSMLHESGLRMANGV